MVGMYMPDEVVKPRRLWVYLSAVDQTRLDELVKKFSNPALGEVQILSTLCAAALKACDDAGGVMPLPLNLTIVGHPTVSQEFRINESKKGRK
jgi:hypothetical protein